MVVRIKLFYRLSLNLFIYLRRWKKNSILPKINLSLRNLQKRGFFSFFFSLSSLVLKFLIISLNIFFFFFNFSFFKYDFLFYYDFFLKFNDNFFLLFNKICLNILILLIFFLLFFNFLFAPIINNFYIKWIRFLFF